MSIISKIRALSQERGISLSFICNALNVNKTYFIDLEKRNGIIPDDKLEIIAHTLFTTTSYLKSNDNIYPEHLPLPEQKYTPVEVNLSEVFNQNNPFTRYISHIWESWNNTLSLNQLLDSIMQCNPFGRVSDWVNIFKYIIISLSESADIIQLNLPKKQKELLREAHNYIISNVKDEYNGFNKFMKNNHQFIITARHLFAHFDHEKNEFFSNFINSTTNFTGCIFNNGFHDFNNPLSLELLISVYKQSYNSTKNSDEEIAKEIITIFSKLSKYIITLDKAIIDFFLCNYTNWNVIIEGKSNQLILVNELPVFNDIKLSLVSSDEEISTTPYIAAQSGNIKNKKASPTIKTIKQLEDTTE